MGEWKEYRLGEVCNRLSSGKNIKAELISNSGAYPVYGGNGIRGYTATPNFFGECAIIGRQGALCGNMPEDWKECHLGDIVTVRYGKDHKDLADGIFPVYGSGGVMRYAEKHLYDKESVLIPRKGSLNNIYYVDDPFWSVDTMFFYRDEKR